MTDRPQRLLLLDSASMYFRAFFGMPEHLAPDGTNVNAVRGMLDYLVRLIEEYRPDAAVCCWDDDWRPQWRVDLVPTYKSHRVVEPVADGADVEEVPDPLVVQVPILREVLQALGLAVIGAPEAEADDVIGTLATRWAAAGTGPVDVVTGDRDLFQLVDDAAGVRVLYIAKGVGRHERVDEAWVQEKYGIRAGQYADFATLRGDASDGLPGVAGIGEKTAAVLLGAHGDLAGVIAAAQDPGSDLKPAARKRILEGLPYLAVAPEVVAVRRTLDVGEPTVTLPTAAADPDAVASLGERWNLTGALTRLERTLAEVGAART